MKNSVKLLGIIALVAVMVFSMIACDNESDPGTGSGTDAPQSVTYVSQDSDGNFYTLVVIEKISRSARYTAKDGDSFTFTVELFNNGKYSVALTYSGTIESAVGSGTEIVIGVTVNGKPLTITVKGTDMTVISGTIVLDNEEEITITEPLTSANTPDDWPVSKRWWSWTDDTATATVTYSVEDDVCAITVGGVAQPNNETDNWGRWKAQASYAYTAEANKRYAYKFEAWTQSGSRTLGIQSYTDSAEDTYFMGRDIKLTTEHKTYTVYGEKIPKNFLSPFSFSCGDQLGTYYVKVLEIKEYEISELKEKNIPMEEWPEDARWTKWVADDSAATLNYSFAPNNPNVCTITVGGKGDPDKWKASAQYLYTAKVNKTYVYTFEAWTQSGTRTLRIQYYNDWDGDGKTLWQDITITPTRKQFVLWDETIPKDGDCEVEFQCANQTGTFYIAYYKPLIREE